MRRASKDESLDSQAQIVRQRIVIGARLHFLAHGFRSVTMDDIAVELGMSKKTLYAHFRSKVELVQAVIRDKFRETNTLLNAITPNAKDDFSGTLQRLLACLQTQTHEIQPAFIRDVQREAPDVFGLVEQLRKELIQLHFGRLFAAGRERGLVRKDIAPELIIAILLGTVQAIMNPLKMLELKLTPEKGFMAITSLLMDGALTPRGRTQ
ncbi:MAG TPA: TetR/AcrR family transcriptional regulator [Steroidobacteraceae bacterium]|nr:TetR/AcrR family transcriptional regulator [Steroidobacteraceae bacterium]